VVLIAESGEELGPYRVANGEWLRMMPKKKASKPYNEANAAKRIQ
jgi:hypothetical protein